MLKGKSLLWIVFIPIFIALFIFSSTNVFAAPDEAPIYYGWLSLLPALVAIGLCFLTKQVLPSLIIGVFVGATITQGWNPLVGFTHTLGILVENLTDSWNATIILFDFVIGGLIGLLFLGGGVYAFAEAMMKKLHNAKWGQVAAYILGAVIFFDDYANTATVGNSFRPVTDKLRISREKFSYIVDATAAPVATLALVSTWVGYEVGLIKDALKAAGSTLAPYTVFLESLPLKFYSIFALVLMAMIVFSGRDFGPMLIAERRARTTGKVFADGARPLSGGIVLRVKEGISYKISNMVVPMVSLIGITLFSIWYTGGGAEVPFGKAIQNADAATSLLWGSMGAVLITIIYFALQRLANLGEMMDSFLEGAKMMVLANLILLSAWSMGDITKSMEAGPFVVNLVEGAPLFIIPVGMFLASCLVSFAMGTSWGTMAIGIPIAVPLGIALGIHPAIMTSTVLTGAIFGDHCSPISDTTVMSSMFSGSDHMDHVNTQIPYAILAGVTAAIGYLLMAFTGFNFWYWGISWVVGFVVLWIALNYLSNRSARALGITPTKDFWKSQQE